MFDVGVVMMLPRAVIRFRFVEPENVTSHPAWRVSTSCVWMRYSNPAFRTPPRFTK
jgi:hypothetical protein